MSDVRHNFAVKKETDAKFKEIMEYFGTDNKTDTFVRMTDQFMDLVWKAERYNRIAENVLAHETLRKYQEGELPGMKPLKGMGEKQCRNPD